MGPSGQVLRQVELEDEDVTSPGWVGHGAAWTAPMCLQVRLRAADLFPLLELLRLAGRGEALRLGLLVYGVCTGRSGLWSAVPRRGRGR